MNILSNYRELSVYGTSVLCMLNMPGLSAQTTHNPQQESCGFDHRHNELMLTDQGYQQRVNAFDQQVLNFTQDAQRGGGTLYVPVVVHVMETGTAITAITDDQVQDGIKWLNERYRKVPGTPGDGNGVDINIEFALAVRDPNGNCTNGITRRDMTGNATYMASGVFDDVSGITDASLKLLDVWPQTQFYNIWLISEFDNNNGGSGTQGYAYFSSSHGQPNDGTVMLVNAYKNRDGITLAHELGNAFNVYHTFQGDDGGASCPANGDCNADGDLVCDTPPHIRSNSDCDFSGTNACDGGSAISLFKNNYMDYAGDACQNMFTTGQNTRIQAAIIGPRASFLAVNGNLSLVPPAAPMLDFYSSQGFLCGTGQSVQLFDKSSCIPNTFLSGTGLPGITFSWSITNGTETHTSVQQNPVFTLTSAGVYNASVSINTGLGTFTRTEQGIVVVAATPVNACTPTSSNAGNFAQTVNNVVFNSISNATSTITNVAYTDFSCAQNTVVAVGNTYSLAISLRAGGSGAEFMNAYIDYNNNGAFEDPSELVASGSQPVNSSGTVTANVTIPGTAVTNTLLRMRIYGETFSAVSSTKRNCTSTFSIGDVEDYGVYISNSVAAVSIAAAPGSTITYGTSVTFTPTPVNGGGAPLYTWLRNGVDVGTSATYVSNDLLPGETIQCSMASNLAGVIASPALSNTVIMVVTGPPLSEFNESITQLCAGNSVTFTDASLLSPTSWSWSFPGGTPSNSTAQNPVISYAGPGTYTVTLIASNGNGTGTTRTKTDHVTVLAVPTSGCTVTRSTSPAAGIGITNVQLNTINKTTVYNGAVMNDYTCSDATTLSANTLYTISVTVGSPNNQWLRAYVDYNNDGDLVDPGEEIFTPATGTGVRSGSFTTPVAPTTGTLLRMRVITDFTNTTAGPCTNLQYGQVEEYGIIFNAPSAIQVAAKAFLNGPYDASTGLMKDDLRLATLIPTTEPFTLLGYSFEGGGGETIAPSVFTVTGANAIVDWVILELRTGLIPAIAASRSALIQRDGDIVDLNGTSPVSFGLAAGNYHVVVRHRNHLGIVTLNPVPLSAVAATVDLTQSGTATFGSNARRSITGAFPTLALWAGDVTFNGEILYTNSGNDRDQILTAIGGIVPTNTIAGYRAEDVNMDGSVVYTGQDNDRDIILTNIGGVVPTHSILEQLP
ncbi:MAG: PKD domain-containing protein [Flavobacteriales bacterium]|nr:PKD domain-containing protein [Flavobacteriales bacterium]